MDKTKIIEFSKLSGSGNDFICIDNRDGDYDAIVDDKDRATKFARALCCRATGVGADGVIFAARPEVEGVSDIAARFFEPDGSECELCGNGTGCFVRWVIDNKWVAPGRVRILTPAGVVIGENGSGGYVKVCIPDPEHLNTDVSVQLGDRPVKCSYVVIGIPHAVLYVDSIDAADVGGLGPALRHHEQFAPQGVNVNFVEIIDTGRLALRTWEFGVEAETLACGTGSAAAAIITAMRENWPDEYFSGKEPILVQTRGGDTLKISFVRESDCRIDEVCLETVVRYIFSGQCHTELAARAVSARQSSAASRDFCAEG